MNRTLCLAMTVIFSLLLTIVPTLAFTYDGDDIVFPFDAAAKARQAHDKAASDMMYQNEEWKAMYYQNEQIIQLLKDMRDEMKMLNARMIKDDKS